MKRRGVMMALGLVTALTACGGGNAGTTVAPSSGPETQAEAKTEERTETDTTGQEEKKESRTEASGDTITLKLSSNQPDGDCITIAVEWFTGQVEGRMDGKVNIEVCNNGIFGDATSRLEQFQYSGMDIVKADLSTVTNFMDEYDALMMPYIYKSTKHFWRAYGEDIGIGILRGNRTREKKLYGLIYYDGGIRCFYNTKKEIRSPEDMKGMLVRVQQSELIMSMVEALGGRLVAAACSEVCSVLQTGVADAVKDSIIDYLDQFRLEVAPYFMEDHRTRSTDTLVMDEESRGKLSAEDLKIIDDTALKSWEYQKELQAETGEESKQKSLEQDVTITKLTEDELKAFQDIYEPIWYPYGGGVYKDIIDQIIEAGK